MPKVDYKQTLKTLYGPSARAVVMVDVPAMNFLMIDGQGSPGESETYREAVEALYPLAYTLKFMLKRSASAIDYGVMPLEGLWWADDMGDFIAGRRERWKWTLMIMQPEFITTDMVATARAEVARKKNPPALPVTEGLSTRNVTLPISASMGLEDAEYVVGHVQELLQS